MIHTFKIAVSACMPIVFSLLVLMVVWAMASTNIFGAKPLDDDGNPYFDTNSRWLAPA